LQQQKKFSQGSVGGSILFLTLLK